MMLSLIIPYDKVEILMKYLTLTNGSCIDLNRKHALARQTPIPARLYANTFPSSGNTSSQIYLNCALT